VQRDSSFTILAPPPPPTPARVGTFDFWKCCTEILNFSSKHISHWALVVSEIGKTLGFSNLQAPSSLHLALSLLPEQGKARDQVRSFLSRWDLPHLHIPQEALF